MDVVCSLSLSLSFSLSLCLFLSPSLPPLSPSHTSPAYCCCCCLASSLPPCLLLLLLALSLSLSRPSALSLERAGAGIRILTRILIPGARGGWTPPTAEARHQTTPWAGLLGRGWKGAGALPAQRWMRISPTSSTEMGIRTVPNDVKQQRLHLL